MNATKHTFADGDTIWIVRRGCVEQHVVRDVATHSGKEYIAETHGDDCYLRIGAGRGATWLNHSDVFTDKRSATLLLVAKLRTEAAAILRQADRLEQEAATST